MKIETINSGRGQAARTRKGRQNPSPAHYNDSNTTLAVPRWTIRAKTTIPNPTRNFPLPPKKGCTSDTFDDPSVGFAPPAPPPIPYIIKLPKAPSPACAAEPNGTVEVPMTNSEEPNETRVPSTVTADAPGETDCVPTAKPVGAAVNVWDPTLKTDMGAEGRGVGFPLTISALPPEGREKVLPANVTAGPPGKTLWPPIAKPVGAAVRVRDPTFKTDMGAEGGRGVALPLTISDLPPEGREKVLPANVTAGPPGRTLWPPIAKPAGAGVIVWPATARIGVGGGGRVMSCR